ncbi:hypothetical protein GKQ77_32035 [Streptomyces sp. BG9H]|uniref:Tetratricopeptide repeat protein n=1 Tax=Streptomyces anatolicus TaxID=2675858 RepID=A0ABS6YXF0_9ACTN|nr:hypothetical protein [Streptomyces anatolicus]
MRDFAGYARELDRLGTGLLDRGEGGGPETASGADGDQRHYRRLISSTWEISLDLLEEQGLPEARLLMRLLSCFAHAPVPAFLLDLDVLEDSGLFPESPGADRCEAALEGLVDLGLLAVEDVTFSRSSDSGEPLTERLPCLTAHPLVLEANALRLREAAGAERERVWHAASAVALSASRLDFRVVETWKVWKLVLPHIEAGIRAVPREEVTSLAAFLWAGKKAHGYAVTSNSRGADDVLARLLRDRSAELPDGHPTQEYLRTTLSEGLEAVHQAYLSMRAKVGEEDAAAVWARASWAHELGRAGNLDQAQHEYQAVLRLLRRTDPDVQSAVAVHADYVRVLAKGGRTEAAQTEARELLRALDAGPRDVVDVAALHVVALALQEAGLLPETEQVHRDQLGRLERAGEQDSDLYLDISSLLCGNLIDQDRAPEALVILDKLLERYESALRSREPAGRDLVKLYQQRARLLSWAHRDEEAEADLRLVLDQLLASLPPHHPTALGSRFQLSSIHRNCGQHSAAVRELDLIDAALDSDEESAAKWRPLSLLCRARASYAAGSCQQALALYEELLANPDQNTRITRAAREDVEEVSRALAAEQAGEDMEDGPSHGT